jgi:serine phosphatase RsbU (regulator of sigma subunit)
MGDSHAGLALKRTAADGLSSPLARVSSAWRWPPSRTAFVAFVVGLAVTAALALVSLALYNRNERRLLHLRARELGLVLQATVPTTQTPLAVAAELANATDGSPQKFRALMTAYVGTGRQFASASLWRLGGPAEASPIVVIGAAPVLWTTPEKARRFVAHPGRPGTLNLTGVIGAAHPTIGFEFSLRSRKPRFAVYAENPLPANRRSSIERNSAFSDLLYVLYLGRSQRSSDLLVTNVGKLPLHGRQAKEVVPFGAASFTLLVASKGSLGGTFFRDLPWLIGVAGILLASAAALLTERLAQGRRRAERLARDLDLVAAQNRDMYSEQRGIAETLQHALLPDQMPHLHGLEVRALYVPAASGVDVGGDWYDVVALDEGRAVLIIGDVSGHGLEAATTMALLRHATLAYVAKDARPAAVLASLSDFVGNQRVRDYFATVLCALIDVDSHRVTLASAGHLAPLLIDGQGGKFLDVATDAAIGVSHNGGQHYRETTVELPPTATLVAFTDGLVERRGEVIDVGLSRLRRLAIGRQLPLEELLAKLAHELASDHTDDTAIVGIQWQT